MNDVIPPENEIEDCDGGWVVVVVAADRTDADCELLRENCIADPDDWDDWVVAADDDDSFEAEDGTQAVRPILVPAVRAVDENAGQVDDIRGLVAGNDRCSRLNS